MLSTSSRQFAWITILSTTQSDHSSEKHTSRRGIATSAGGALPSESFQTNSRLFSSQVGHAPMRAFGGIRLQYGIDAHCPSPLQAQPWNGHTRLSPCTVPRLRSAPMCGQYASTTLILPVESANAASLRPNAFSVCGL